MKCEFRFPYKGPCIQVETLAPLYLETTLRPKYILSGYMDSYVL